MCKATEMQRCVSRLLMAAVCCDLPEPGTGQLSLLCASSIKSCRLHGLGACCGVHNSLWVKTVTLLKSTYAQLVCLRNRFAMLHEAKTSSCFCAVMQEWQKLGAEYVASKHNAKSLHRLEAALQVLHRLAVVLTCTVQILMVHVYTAPGLYLQEFALL